MVSFPIFLLTLRDVLSGTTNELYYVLKLLGIYLKNNNKSERTWNIRS